MHFRSSSILQMTLAGILAISVSGAATAQTTTTPQTTTTAGPVTSAVTATATTPEPPAPPAPLTTPSVTGPLQWLPPAMFDAGPLGKIAANGIVTGFGMVQSNHVPGDDNAQAALSNGQIFIQKADGKFQYFIQAGAYTLPSLATAFLPADKTVSNFYGALPVAFAKVPVGKTTQFLIGSLPTLIGAEYTFTFQNMNIERGFLWNQEPAISRGIQVNQALGKSVNLSFSWNDGYYSNRYSWLSGSLSFVKGPHALAFVAGGNLSQSAYQTPATPLQNNSSIYNVIYTFTKGSWIVQPYYQYSSVPTNTAIGVVKGASTNGGALLVSHAFKHGFSLPARVEYITTSGSTADEAANLLFGPGSTGTSITATPTFQYGGLFFRGDVSWAHAGSYVPGTGFGNSGTDANQVRGIAEVGFIFGHNIIEK
jgi:Putative beta-barrel porin-2, OmpL-like. bbp2